MSSPSEKKWRPAVLFRIGTLALVLTIGLGCPQHSSVVQAAEDFSVDTVAYSTDRRETLKRLLNGREFHPGSGCEEEYGYDPKKCFALLTSLRNGKFKFIPPFEASATSPDLPTYLEVRKRCGDKIDFEFSRANGFPTRATENFALYRVSTSQPGESVLGFRAERYILQDVDWGRRRLENEKSYEYWPGTFYLFNPETCQTLNTAVLHRHEGSSFKNVLNEPILIDNRLFVLSLYPIETGSHEYRISLWEFDTKSFRQIHIYSMTTLRP